jgi:hypothetical protein
MNTANNGIRHAVRIGLKDAGQQRADSSDAKTDLAHPRNAVERYRKRKRPNATREKCKRHQHSVRAMHVLADCACHWIEFRFEEVQRNDCQSENCGTHEGDGR